MLNSYGSLYSPFIASNGRGKIRHWSQETVSPAHYFIHHSNIIRSFPNQTLFFCPVKTYVLVRNKLFNQSNQSINQPFKSRPSNLFQIIQISYILFQIIQTESILFQIIPIWSIVFQWPFLTSQNERELTWLDLFGPFLHNTAIIGGNPSRLGISTNLLPSLAWSQSCQ